MRVRICESVIFSEALHDRDACPMGEDTLGSWQIDTDKKLETD